MAISPSYNQIAFFNNKGTAYVFSSKFDKGRKETKFEINEDLTKEEQEELKSIINYDNKNFQFLFCGEDALALYGNKFVLIVDITKKTLVYKIIEEENQSVVKKGIYAKCISEVDGLRIGTNTGIYFISKVDKNLYKACDPFEKNPAKKLLEAIRQKKRAAAWAHVRTVITEASADLIRHLITVNTDGFRHHEGAFFNWKAAWNDI